MNRINNMKIGTKLKSSFMISAILILLVGSYGIYNMNSINKNTETIYKVDLIGVKDISQVKSNIIHINLKMLQLSDEKDTKVITKLENEIDELRQADDKFLAEYNTTIRDSLGQIKFDTFNKLLVEYRGLRKQIVTLINEVKYADAKLYYPDLFVINDKIVANLDDYAKYALDQSVVDYQKSKDLYKLSFILITILILFVVISGIVISFRLTATISKQINKLLTFAEDIGKGNLENTIDIQSGDELGSLSKELNKAALSRKEFELNLAKNYQELEASHEEITALEEELRVKFNELSISEEHLKKKEEWYKLITESSYDALLDWDIKEDKEFFTDRWYQLLGYERNNHRNIRDWLKLINPEDINKVKDTIRNHWENRTDFYKVDYRIAEKSGEYIWISSTGKTLFDNNGKPYRMAGSNKDITEIRNYEKKLKHSANHDYLTDLPNRKYMYDKFKNDFEINEKSLVEGAILFIDVDNFKFINDTMGHAVGDELICAIGERLRTLVDEDAFLVRLGGDEFIFAIKDRASKKAIEEFATSILDLLNAPFEFGDSSLQLTASIGVAMFPKDGNSIDEILKKADIAMYQSKYNGKNRFTFFDDAMNKSILERMKIEKNLRNALKNNEFTLFYQPQVEVTTGKISSFEALIRWNNKELGFVSPNDFIGIAEENQMIIEIGQWVMKTACEFIKDVNDNHNSDCHISVNVSVLQFLQSDFVDTVFRILDETEAKPHHLELEITESIYIENYDAICEKLVELRAIGIRIALDDFGKGYSSLSYLKELPIDTLKIDKVFIDDICINGERSLVEIIIKMGHKMKLSIIAEGVESDEQHEYLKEFHCNKIQGYLFSRPVPKDKAVEMLHKVFTLS